MVTYPGVVVTDQVGIFFSQICALLWYNYSHFISITVQLKVWHRRVVLAREAKLTHHEVQVVRRDQAVHVQVVVLDASGESLLE